MDLVNIRGLVVRPTEGERSFTILTPPEGMQLQAIELEHLARGIVRFYECGFPLEPFGTCACASLSPGMVQEAPARVLILIPYYREPPNHAHGELRREMVMRFCPSCGKPLLSGLSYRAPQSKVLDAPVAKGVTEERRRIASWLRSEAGVTLDDHSAIEAAGRIERGDHWK